MIHLENFFKNPFLPLEIFLFFNNRHNWIVMWKCFFFLFWTIPLDGNFYRIFVGTLENIWSVSCLEKNGATSCWKIRPRYIWTLRLSSAAISLFNLKISPEDCWNTYRPSFFLNKNDDKSNQEKTNTQQHQHLMNLKIKKILRW